MTLENPAPSTRSAPEATTPIPQLFLVGAPKCGTSGMANFLAQHPKIAICTIKEPNYFNRDMELGGPRTVSEYLALFPDHEATDVLTDCSILYLYSQRAAEEIHEFNPRARILMILRNPIEAMVSWHGQMVFTCNEPILDFESALAAESDRRRGERIPTAGTTSHCPELLFYRQVFNYHEQLERFREVFDPEQIRVVIYDDFREDAAKCYAEILEFAELPAFEPDFAIINPSRERRSRGLHMFLKRYFAGLSRLLPARLRLDIINFIDRINSRSKKREPIPNALLNTLREECKPDVDALSTLLGRDLSHWYQPPPPRS